MRRAHIVFGLSFLVLFAVVSVCFGDGRLVMPAQAQWTFAFYLAGENSLEYEQASNLQEIIKGSAGLKQTHVVVFFDRDERFKLDNPITSWKGTRVFHLVEPLGRTLRSPLAMQLPSSIAANRFEQLILARLADPKDRLRLRTAYRKDGDRYRLGDIPDQMRDDTLQLLVEKTDYLLPLRGQAPINLAAADELTQRQFFCFIGDNFPAQRYALFMAGHGSGWFEDDPPSVQPAKATEPAEYRQTLKGTALAAAASWHHFDLIVMDSCLMADVETLWTLRHAADFLVLNQIQTPAWGLDYTKLLQTVGRTSGITPRQLANSVVDSYAADFGKTRYPISTAAFETSRIEPLARQWHLLGGMAQLPVRLQSIQSDVPNIPTATFLKDTMVDMSGLCRAVGMKELAEAINGPDGVMIGSYHQHTSGRGLSVYLPKNSDTFSRTIEAYRRTQWVRDFPKGWISAVEKRYAATTQEARGAEDAQRP